MPELLTEFPYDQTKKALTAKGTKGPVTEDQIEGIRVEWQLMKDNVKVTVQERLKLWFVVQMFAENSTDEFDWTMVKDDSQDWSDPSIFSAIIKAPFHAPKPGYYRIEISSKIYNLGIGADPNPPDVKGEVWIKVNSGK